MTRSEFYHSAVKTTFIFYTQKTDLRLRKIAEILVFEINVEKSDLTQTFLHQGNLLTISVKDKYLGMLMTLNISVMDTHIQRIIETMADMIECDPLVATDMEKGKYF